MRGYLPGGQAGDPGGGDRGLRIPGRLVGSFPQAEAAGPLRIKVGGLGRPRGDRCGFILPLPGRFLEGMPVPPHPEPPLQAPKGRRQELHQELRAVSPAPGPEAAHRHLLDTVARWETIRPEVAEKLEEARAGVLACFHFPAPHRRRIRTTNCVKRMLEEMRKRTRVVRIFPNRESDLRLITALCVEQSEERGTGRRYLDMSLPQEEKPEDVPLLSGMAV